jgi:hypothetical protein
MAGRQNSCLDDGDGTEVPVRHLCSPKLDGFSELGMRDEKVQVVNS